MKNLSLVLLLFIFWWCNNEYSEFHKFSQEQNTLAYETQNFSLDEIGFLSGVTLRYTPDLELLDLITDMIDIAQQRVYLESYILTEKRIQSSLLAAYKRWVDVKVIVEKNVFWNPSINSQSFKFLDSHSIPVIYSAPSNYTLNHTKMLIVDEEVILSTGNYSYATFKTNRDFFIFINNWEIFANFLEIFESDFAKIKKNISHSHIVLSPYSSRIKLETLLKSAQESIMMYSYNFSDESIKDILLEQYTLWVEIGVIFPSLKKIPSNEDIGTQLRERWLKVTYLQKPETHAKVILIDNQYLYIGSINFSPSSIDKNREVGILLSNWDILDEVREIFESDFEK